MRFAIGNVLKYGLPAIGLLLSIDLLHLYYFYRKDYIASRPIHEVAFIMSDGLPCCTHYENPTTIENCENPHCKAKVSNRIINHIHSAKHLICIAM